MTPSELYADVRTRMSGLALSEEDAARPVPGCPGWTVRDVYAHAAGILADVRANRLENATTDEWTGRQVDERRGTPLPAILDEWADHATVVEPTLDTMPKAFSRTLLIDLVTHEHDVRGALRRPGGRESEAYEIARKGFAVGLAYAVKERGLPGVVLAAPDWSFAAGDSPDVTLTAPDSFEIFRALAGRRGIKQVLAWEWDGDPAPYLPILNHFGPIPDDDVVEE
jgi:uncharacterized protein (TIGR03083 family)